VGYVSLLVCAALLALGTIVVFPFEMETIIALAGNRLVARGDATPVPCAREVRCTGWVSCRQR
jgi:hypothetical protein